MAQLRCPQCHKPIKENTDGNMRYCQGHDFLSDHIQVVSITPDAKPKTDDRLYWM